MPSSLIQLIIKCLSERERALTPREIARTLLNDRTVSEITLDALTERIHVDLSLERHTRGEASRFICDGDRYSLLERDQRQAEREVTAQATRRDLESSPPPKAEVHANALDPTTRGGLGHSSLGEESEHNERWSLDISIRDYPLAHQVSTMLSLTHGERYTLVESLRRALRRLERETQGVTQVDAQGGEEHNLAETGHAPTDDVKSHEVDGIAKREARPALRDSSSSQPMTVEQWLSAHLMGGAAQLARRLWDESGRLVSPRRFESCWSLIERYELMEVAADGAWRVSERGMQLMSRDHHSVETERDIAREVDEREGLRDLLLSCLELGQPKFEQLASAWSSRLRRAGKRRARAWVRDALRSRLRHLSERGLIQRDLSGWRLTEEGLAWLRGDGTQAPSADYEALEAVWAALGRQRELARESIATLLNRMDPHRFEELVCELLERMGYEDIYLTTHTRDMGVDVVATIELGITAAREVVQVKRQHRAIHRPTLDALRGSLHRFNAVRGTLITTSTFSKGTREAAFERGAAPITLIDGERLIDLLMTHELGVKPIEVKLWQVSPRVFEEGSGRAWPRWSQPDTHPPRQMSVVQEKKK